MTDADKETRIRRLQKVLEISRSMAATEDLDELLQLIIARSMELLDAERATIFLYDADSDELISRVAAGTDEIRISAGTGLAGAAARSGKIVNVPDAYADKRFNPDVDRQTGFTTRNILSVPMQDYHGNLVGVLEVLNKRRGEFDQGDIALAETFAAQAGVAIQRANLIEHFLLKQQMERAMKIAQDIQRGLLPKGAPAIEGFDVAGFSRPADQTGGDTYDFMSLPDGRWMFIVADATGHGIGPALVIAETRAMLRAICRQASGAPAPSAPQPAARAARPDSAADVSAVLATTNELLLADLDNGRFVTCFLGMLDPAAESLTYASAGHGPILFYSAASGDFGSAGATSLPLGVMPDMGYAETVTHAFAGGDLAAIITDGFVETVNPKGEEFGVARTTNLLKSCLDRPAAEMIENLVAAVDRFAEGKPQADDLTAVIIRKL